jgi:SAM-dependent methyltransferase
VRPKGEELWKRKMIDDRESAIMNLLRKNRLVQRILSLPLFVVLKLVINEITPYFHKGERILTIGAGSCFIDRELLKQGFDVTSLDVKNTSLVKGIDPTIYDGNKIPFKDKEFDVAIIFYVLHHTKDPDQLLLEAKRVARRLFIKEDLYTSSWQKRFVFLVDSILNLEFAGHPHSNRRDEEWRDTFQRLGLRMVESKVENYMLYTATGKYFLDAE